MKRKNLLSLLGFIFLVSFTVPAMANSLSFRGYGAWRSENNAPGKYTVHKNILWSNCLKLCSDSTNCKGVEYSMRPNGDSICELHKDKLGSIKSSSSGTGLMVWTKN